MLISDLEKWIQVLTKNKEQYSGIESIGSIVTEDNNQSSNPMDNAEGTTDNTTPDDTTPQEDVVDNSEPETIDTIDSATDQGDTSSSFNDSENTNSETTDFGMDENSEPEETLDDPNIAENRRILLTEKLIQLHWSIKSSIDEINKSNSFEKKPVILKELNRLADIVIAINSSINNVVDYKIILLKYTMCTKVYNKILQEI